jgi:hypothetical protein
LETTTSTWLHAGKIIINVQDEKKTARSEKESTPSAVDTTGITGTTTNDKYHRHQAPLFSVNGWGLIGSIMCAANAALYEYQEAAAEKNEKKEKV